MNMENILEVIYTQASKRIKKKVQENKNQEKKPQKSNLTQAKIYPPDPKQISWIINNNRTKNNRFLICDRVLESSTEDGENGGYEKIGLIPKLNFNNKQEALWGKEEEILTYTHPLFVAIITELENRNEYGIDLNYILCDYVPYAKCYSYWDILFVNNDCIIGEYTDNAGKVRKIAAPALFYGIYENDISNIDTIKNEAMEILYKKCKNEFEKDFIAFCKKTDSFHRINSVFKTSFIEKHFISMIKKYIPDDNSLGIRIKKLIESDLKNVPKLLFDEIEDKEYIKELIGASSSYAVALEKIQKKQYEAKYNLNN